jgi:uncharacterized RDD family membrane protein YckC
MSQSDFPVPAEPPVLAPAWRPAGFWVRVAAALIDGVVLSPLTVGSFCALFSVKSLPLVLLLSLPGLVYKPLLESRYGATLGKMACGLRVIDRRGGRLGLGAAYLRFAPFLAQAVVGLATTVWVFSTPQFQEVSGLLELGRLMQQSPFNLLSTVLNWFILIDCVTVAFTARKRALHDMMADSYCVWAVA